MGLSRIFMQVMGVFVLVSGMAAAVVAFPIAKRPHCQDQCGDVKIPYPFGITEDCYLNKYFRINCSNDSSGLPQPVVGKNLVVTNISIDGELDILMYISRQCYENSSGVLGYNKNPSLRVPAFTISNTKNKFVAVGCDTYAYLNAYRNNERFSIGCMSICRSPKSVINGSCSGIGCCQVDIPKGLKNFTLDARSYNNHTRVSKFNPCSFAFVAKQDSINFSSVYLRSMPNRRTPMVLDWAINGTETCENSKNVCGMNSHCYHPENGDGCEN